MSGKTEEYINKLTAEGEISCTIEQLCRELDITYNAALVALNRLKKQTVLVSPSKGYYLILTPEYRASGSLPADFFIDNLMRHLHTDYYVSLLSAALYYGAAHQQPQMLQVMIPIQKRHIQCGNVSIEFIKNNQCTKTPIKKINTRTGYINVSTPEATAIDMIKYVRQCGGMSRIVTVIDELAESMDCSALTQLATASSEPYFIHRLGFLLDELGHEKLASALYTTINKKQARFIPLVPYESMHGMPTNKKWHIVINAIIESDLNDTE